jgi:hypothetical protein
VRVAAAISTWLAVGFLAVFTMGGARADILEVEPDLFPEFTVLTNAFPGVTLTNQSGMEKTVISLDGFSQFVFDNTSPQIDNIATTGTLVFGRDQIVAIPRHAKVWADAELGNIVGLLRADFYPPVDSVTIDLVCDDDDDGFLRAYNAAGTLLAEDPDPPTVNPDSTCDGLGRDGPDGVALPVFFPATITRSTADIAYVLAGGTNMEPLYLDNLRVNFRTLPVFIDIKPDDDQNKINICAKRTLPVAILSFPKFSGGLFFDAMDIDPLTVDLEGAGVKTVGKNPERAKFKIQDVNGDGLQDMVVEIDTKGFDGVNENTEEMTLTGLSDGTPFVGKDAVDITQFMCVRSLE